MKLKNTLLLLINIFWIACEPVKPPVFDCQPYQNIANNSNQILSYEYNEAGIITKLTNQNFQSIDSFNFVYNELGMLTKIIGTGGGLAANYTYSNTIPTQLTSVELGMGPIFFANYTFNEKGKANSVLYAFGDFNDSTALVYDNNNNLTRKENYVYNFTLDDYVLESRTEYEYDNKQVIAYLPNVPLPFLINNDLGLFYSFVDYNGTSNNWSENNVTRATTYNDLGEVIREGNISYQYDYNYPYKTTVANSNNDTIVVYTLLNCQEP